MMLKSLTRCLMLATCTHSINQRYPPNLLNIETGAEAPKHIEISLIGALDKGAEMAAQYVTERLIQVDGHSKRSIYEPSKKYGLKTMREMKKTIKIRSNKDVFLDAEIMYLRFLKTMQPIQ